MSEHKKITLPSGAELEIQLAPFKKAKALGQALLEEAQETVITRDTIFAELVKTGVCVGFSSPKIEKALWACIDHCLYNGVRITEATFESREARDDYMTVCTEVAMENCLPFVKSLYAKYKPLLLTIFKGQK